MIAATTTGGGLPPITPGNLPRPHIRDILANAIDTAEAFARRWCQHHEGTPSIH